MHTCKLLIETHESLGNPAMKGTRNWIQPFQWASSSTAMMKLTMRAMDLVALKICRNVFVYMALLMCSSLAAEYHPHAGSLFPRPSLAPGLIACSNHLEKVVNAEGLGRKLIQRAVHIIIVYLFPLG